MSKRKILLISSAFFLFVLLGGGTYAYIGLNDYSASQQKPDLDGFISVDPNTPGLGNPLALKVNIKNIGIEKLSHLKTKLTYSFNTADDKPVAGLKEQTISNTSTNLLKGETLTTDLPISVPNDSQIKFLDITLQVKYQKSLFGSWNELSPVSQKLPVTPVKR